MYNDKTKLIYNADNSWRISTTYRINANCLKTNTDLYNFIRSFNTIQMPDSKAGDILKLNTEKIISSEQEALGR